MKAKKLTRYRIPVSVTFPQTHPRKGDRTYFKDKIEFAIGRFDACHIIEHDTKNEFAIEPKNQIKGNQFDLNEDENNPMPKQCEMYESHNELDIFKG